MTDSEDQNSTAMLTVDAEGELEFPCRYPVKSMTRTGDQALEQVLRALMKLGTRMEHDTVRIRPSRNGRFQSITVEVNVESREELERIYAEVRALDVVLMTL